jgi:hypothetical protein
VPVKVEAVARASDFWRKNRNPLATQKESDGKNISSKPARLRILRSGLQSTVFDDLSRPGNLAVAAPGTGALRSRY